MPRELILLSPYTPPTQHALMLGVEETNCWLNAWSALWHPSAILGASAPPKWASPYDYDPPVADHIYAIPETPPLYLAGDWDDRVREVRAAAFRSDQGRQTTLEKMYAALAEVGQHVHAGELTDSDARPFFGIGLAYAVIETLFDAMEHERLLDRDGFWADMQEAARNPGSALPHLQKAAAKLQSARDTLYPANISLLDFAILDEKHASAPLPAAIDRQSPINVIATGKALEEIAREYPDRIRALKSALSADSSAESRLEICGGPYCDREDELLPLESQLWNLRHGIAATKSVLGCDVTTYASARGCFHLQTPSVLQQFGIAKALLISFDDGRLPSHKAAVIQWSTADGRQIEALTRTPLPADDPQTYFHLTHYLHQTIMQDQSAIVGLLHRPGVAAAPWYEDWLALSTLGPVLGAWTTVSNFLREGVVGEYASPPSVDEFAIDALEPRCEQPGENASVSWFARHLRLRRRLDASATYAALYRALGGGFDLELHDRFSALEDRIEQSDSVRSEELEKIELLVSKPLIARLLSRATERKPGLFLLNPCAFARRVTLEGNDIHKDVLPGGAIKSIQHDADQSRLVAEIPALGFAWLPRTADISSSQARNPRPIKLADQKSIRNEYLEAEIDPSTGGLRSIRDLQSRENRIGQQLVFQPGSRSVVEEIQVTSTGPALGEIVSTGALVDEHDEKLATFRQRFRVWLGRPLLEMRIELFVVHKPTGYPWHAYYGSRFAWRDERATLIRGVVGQGATTTHSRPTTPDYLELRSGRHRTLILPGGLPFHQRHGARMLDVILVPQGESATTFELAISLDRELPMQTAWGFTSPVLAVPVEMGPPHIGPTGWLFHVDAPNLLMTSLAAEAGDSAVVNIRLLEVAGVSGSAELRCPRNPESAELVDALGETQQSLLVQDDSVQFDYSEHGLINIRVRF